MGYFRAGFDEIIGVDVNLQPRYPFEFIQNDATEYLKKHWYEFDAFHASPPCQRYSKMSIASGTQDDYPDLIDITRRILRLTGKPYVIENVPGAPLENPLMLCGTMFPGLRVIRHRLFETYPVIWFPPSPCNHRSKIPRAGRGSDGNGWISVAGHFGNVDAARQAMGIDWMTRDELSQAIPPAYTEWIGKHILKEIQYATHRTLPDGIRR